jgi:hypothetical protein
MRPLYLFVVAVSIVSVALFVALILSFPSPEQIVWDLSAGWAHHLGRVVPQMQVSWPGVLTAAGCLVGLAAGLHFLFRRLPGARPWPFRWTAALLCSVVLMFVAGLSAVGVSDQSIRLATSPEPLVSTRAGWDLTQQTNDLKNMALAMHNYESDHHTFPPAAVWGKDGRPLLSWRVLILPYLEEENLYKRFHLDEPWDSPHNLRLLPRIPPYYRSHTDRDDTLPHRTHYQVFVGKGAAFEGKQGLSPTKDFPDGTSNTILIVDAAEAVPWTKPEDLPYDPARPLPALGHISPKLFRVALGDASVRTLYHNLNEQTLRAAITRNGGETLGPDW